jgi:hypothetical protein
VGGGEMIVRLCTAVDSIGSVVRLRVRRAFSSWVGRRRLIFVLAGSVMMEPLFLR